MRKIRETDIVSVYFPGDQAPLLNVKVVGLPQQTVENTWQMYDERCGDMYVVQDFAFIVRHGA